MIAFGTIARVATATEFHLGKVHASGDNPFQEKTAGMENLHAFDLVNQTPLAVTLTITSVPWRLLRSWTEP